MQAYQFTGWIEKILPANDYRQEIVVRDYENESTKEKFSNTLTFSFGVKNGAVRQMDGIGEGDKVQIAYYVTGKAGVSKTGKYYHINELNVAKMNGIRVLAKAHNAPDVEDPQIEDDGSVDALPF